MRRFGLVRGFGFGYVPGTMEPTVSVLHRPGGLSLGHGERLPSLGPRHKFAERLLCWMERYPRLRVRLQVIGQGLLYYALTSFVAVLGVMAGHGLLIPCFNGMRAPDLGGSFAVWDGNWYRYILVHGYSYDPSQPSTVAFFPAFPVLGRLVWKLTGLSPALALLLVSHLSLAGSFIVLAGYVRHRFPSGPPHLAAYVLLALGLMPTGFFFRLAYTESLFLLLTVLTLYGLERRWPLVLVALIIGLATATRAPGVCLLGPLLLHVWRQSASVLGFLARMAWLGPLACWGLAAYMSYQFVAFDQPLAWAQAHGQWHMRPDVPWGEKVRALATFEPLRAVYRAGSPAYWRWHPPPHRWPVFSLCAANPLYFVGTCGLLLWGARQRWLTAAELLLAVGLVLVPYSSRGYEMCMISTGRFMAVIFPVHLVLGNEFVRWPAPLVAGLLAASGTFVLIYAALFAAGYPLL
jgi:hypothetical protein